MISPARQSAQKAIWNYRRQGKTVLQSCQRTEDTRLAECIVQGVLQNERFLDACLSGFIPSGLNKLHPQVLDLLRMAAFQILFLERVPDSAAVNDAVALCRKTKAAYSSGLVNAVLRRICSQKAQLLNEPIDPAIRYSHPDWLVRELMEDYSEDFVLSFLKSNQLVPPICLQINTKKCDLDGYLELLREKQFNPISVNLRHSSVLVSSTDVVGLPGYRDGLFYVQDDAARAAVKSAGISSGMKVLDACAAPGGKSMAAFLDGADVLSCDVNENRLRICEENYRRMKMDIPIVQMDAEVLCPDYDKAFDLVIADVPCSGTGVIRKHPEIRTKTRESVNELKDIQKKIFSNLARYVRPGGSILYSTCSVLREENEEQVSAFLKCNPEFVLEQVNVDGFECANGMLRSWPNQNGNDGFFAARLKRQND